MRLGSWWSLVGLSACFVVAAVAGKPSNDPLVTQGLAVSPTSAGLGTVITLSVTPQIAGLELRPGTTALWEGVYDPPLGANTTQFTVDYAGSNIIIVDSWTARVLIGGGTISNAPNVEAVMGGGSLVGAFTLTTPPICIGDANFDNTVDFADTTAVLSNWGADYGPGNTGPGDANRDGAVGFADTTAVLSNWDAVCSNTVVQGSAGIALNTGAGEWRQIDYPDGPGPDAMDPPEIGPAASSILIHRNSLYATPPAPPVEQLVYATDAHHAIQVRVSENADSAAAAPATIKVDLLSLDASGQIVDREAGLTLTRVANDGDPANIIYRSDLLKPVIILDQAVDQASYPQFTLLFGTITGRVTIAPSTQGQEGRSREIEMSQCQVVSTSVADVDPSPRLPAQDDRPAVETLAERLRQRPASRAAFEQVLADVAESFRRDPAGVAALSSVLNDPATDPRIRLALFGVFMEAEDASALRAVLAAARANIDRISDDGQEGLEARWRVDAALHGLLGHPHLAEMEGDPNLLKLLEWGSRHSYEGVGQGTARSELMLSAPVDEITRSHLFTNLFLYPSAAESLNCRMPLEIINAEDRARLRRPLEEWAGEPRDFPGKAVMVLVMLGDEATLQLLREWSVSDRLKDERMRARFTSIVLLGETYHDPAAALRYVRSSDNLSGSDLVICALASAVRLGVSREELRAALFERERKVEEWIALHSRQGPWRQRLKSGWLWPIKEAALEMRLLEPNEWPQVEAPLSMEESGLTP